jgi:hypothetical protein
MDSMIETMVTILGSAIGTLLGIIFFLRVLFKEFEKFDYDVDYDELEGSWQQDV